MEYANNNKMNNRHIYIRAILFVLALMIFSLIINCNRTTELNKGRKTKHKKNIENYNNEEFQDELVRENDTVEVFNTYRKDGRLETRTTYIHDSIIIKEVFLGNGNLESRSQGVVYDDGNTVMTNSFYYENGYKRAEHQFVNDILNGYSKYWNEDGFLWHCSYRKNGLLDGNYEEWYPSGKMQAKGFFENGSGHIHYYYENGYILKEGHLKNDKEDGVWIYYYENGMKQSEGLYENGSPNGNYKVWDFRGKLIEVGMYRDGVIIDVKRF